MKKILFLLLFNLLCFPVYAISLETVFQLGERKHPTLDRLLPDVARYMAFNKDSTRLIVKGMDGTLVAWDILSRKRQELGRIKAKSLFVYAAGSDQLLLQNTEGITILNLSNDVEVKIAEGSYECGNLSGDGTSIVLSEGDSTFGLWQIDKKGINLVQTVRTVLPVRNGLAISDDGKYIAAAEGTYRDGEGHRTLIEIWDTTDAIHPIRVLNTGEGLGVWNLIFSDNGDMLAVDTQLNGKSGIRVWNIKTGAQLLNKSGFEAYWTRALAFGPPDNTNATNYIASGDEQGNLHVWNISSGESEFWETFSIGIQTLAFSPNGDYLAVALWDTTIQILRWKRNE